jgi:hypothetical protein
LPQYFTDDGSADRFSAEPSAMEYWSKVACETDTTDFVVPHYVHIISVGEEK